MHLSAGDDYRRSLLVLINRVVAEKRVCED
jgi:hypothetical protein